MSTLKPISIDNPFVKAESQSHRADTLYQTTDYVQKKVTSSPTYTVISPDYRHFVKYGYKGTESWGEWVLRKTGHLPGALISTVKAPLHVLKAFTAGPFQGTFRTNLYRAGCDLEETKGHLMGLAWDPLYEYHRESSKLHKQCYDIMDQSGTPPPPKTEGMTKAGFDNLGARYVGLTQEQLDQTPLEKIAELTLTLDCDRFYRLNFSKDQLQKIPLAKLSQSQLSGLFPPFNLSSSSASKDERVVALHAFKAKLSQQKKEKAFTRLKVFSGPEIESVKEKLAPECYALHKAALASNKIEDEGLTMETFSDFDPAIVVQALLANSIEQTIQKLHEIDQKVLIELLPYLPIDIIFKISISKISVMTDEQRDAFFNASRKKECQPRVDQLTAYQVSLFLPLLTVSQIHAFNFSNEQLSLLDLKVLDQKKLDALFPLLSLTKQEGSGLLSEIKKVHAKKQILVLKRIHSLTETHKSVIKDRLPELWSLYSDWESKASNPQLDAIKEIMDFVVIDAPKPKKEKPKTDGENSTPNEPVERSLLQKVYDFVVGFFYHACNGLSMVTRFVTYPIWKSVQIGRAWMSSEKETSTDNNV